MDNILYIGPYREFSGMGNAARNYIKALIRTGHNVSVRPIYNIFKPYPLQEIDNEIIELESNFSKSYDTVIQHCYPHQLTLDKRFNRNIGIIHLESMGYGNGIVDYINLMDMVIVQSNRVYQSLIYAGIDNSKIKIIPEPIDIDIINNYKNNNVKNNKKFSFYTIADLIDRKNLDKIIMAYSLAYDADDDIDLVIKLKNFTSTDIHIEQTVDYMLSKIYAALKRNNIQKPKVILGDIKYDAIMYMHHNNSCFINLSSGESFGYSTLEAMAFNNNIIVNDKIGSTEILDENCGLINKITDTCCIDPDRLYYQYNTIDNTWVQPNLESVINNMYKASNETAAEKQSRIDAQNAKLQLFTMDAITEQFLSL